MFSNATRREFVGGLGIAAFGYALPPELFGASAETSAVDKREEYLFAPGLIYLNTAALGPCPRRVVEETQRAWHAMEASPAAMAYSEGATLAAAEAVRAKAASFLRCNMEQVVITRSTTDGMNAVAQGLTWRSGDRILTSDQEHEGGTYCWTYSAKRHGLEIDTVAIPLDEHDPARIVQRFADRVTPRTRVISVSHVLSSTGLRMPVAQLAALARSTGALCVVDGAQTAGGIEVDVTALGCHAFATSGHKWLLGPKGTGLLYIAPDAEEHIRPIQLDDGRAYYNHSGGVGNLPGAIGLGVALAILDAAGIAAVQRHNMALRNRLYSELQNVPTVEVVSAEPGLAASQLVAFSVPAHIDSQALLRSLRDKHRIIVKMVPKRWMNGIRLSPHVFNTDEHVDAVLSALRSELG